MSDKCAPRQRAWWKENRVSVTVAGEEEQLYVRAQVTTGGEWG